MQREPLVQFVRSWHSHWLLHLNKDYNHEQDCHTRLPYHNIMSCLIVDPYMTFFPRLLPSTQYIHSLQVKWKNRLGLISTFMLILCFMVICTKTTQTRLDVAEIVFSQIWCYHSTPLMSIDKHIWNECQDGSFVHCNLLVKSFLCYTVEIGIFSLWGIFHK